MVTFLDLEAEAAKAKECQRRFSKGVAPFFFCSSLRDKERWRARWKDTDIDEEEKDR
jgi:hypothetical protein